MLQFVQLLQSNKPIFVGLLKTWALITAFSREWDYPADEVSSLAALRDDTLPS